MGSDRSGKRRPAYKHGFPDPERVVQEWIEAGNLFPDVSLVRPETTYGNSRFDLYVEAGEKKIFIEVKA